MIFVNQRATRIESHDVVYMQGLFRIFLRRGRESVARNWKFYEKVFT